MLWASGPGNIPGKSVRTSIRMSPPLGRRGDHPPRRRVDLANEGRDHREIAILPPRPPDDQVVVGRPGLHRHHRAKGSARLVHNEAADRVDPVELVFGEGGKFVVSHGDDRLQQRFRRLDGVDPRQSENGAAARTLRRHHFVVADLPGRRPVPPVLPAAGYPRERISYGSGAAPGEPQRLRGQDPRRIPRERRHLDLAPNAVEAGDSADVEKLHGGGYSYPQYVSKLLSLRLRRLRSLPLRRGALS